MAQFRDHKSEWIVISDAAIILGLGRIATEKLIKQGAFTIRRFPGIKVVRVLKSDVDRAAAASVVLPSAATPPTSRRKPASA